MSKYLKRKLRERAESLIQFINLDAPDNILAMSIRLVFDAATADFGEELYAEMGKAAKVNARQRWGLCSTCDTEIPTVLTHPPLCVDCEEKQEAMADEVDDEQEAKMNRLLNAIYAAIQSRSKHEPF